MLPVDWTIFAALRMIGGYRKVAEKLREQAAVSAEAKHDVAVAFRKTRNWSLIMLGPLAVVIGTTIHLVHTISTKDTKSAASATVR